MNAPSLATAVKKAITFSLTDVNTCLPGRIEKYDYAKQKADVKPLIKKLYVDGTTEALPVIVNVPVVWPRGGGGSLTFPLEKGDGVLLVFSQRSLDTWLSKGGDTGPGDPRKFDLSDAIAIPGLFPFSETGDAVDNTNCRLTFKGGTLKIDNTGKIAFGNTSQELLDLFDQLIDALVITTTATALGPQLLSKSIDTTFTQIKTKLAAIKGSL